ncbi:hypothetical protein D3C77_704760 [compost metagenome]
MELGVVRLVFSSGKELLDDGVGVLLAVFKGAIDKALSGRVIQGALVKARGLSVFIQLFGGEQGLF